MNVRVVGSGRGPVDVKVELIQGATTKTLFLMRVPGNELAFFDPRSQRASHHEQITIDQMKAFANGPATVRATATGREQWTRLPPPTVRESLVELHKN